MPRRKKGVPADAAARKDIETALQGQNNIASTPILATDTDHEPSEHISHVESALGHDSNLRTTGDESLETLPDANVDDDVHFSQAGTDEYKQEVRHILSKAGYKRPKNVKQTRDAKLKTTALNKLGPVVKQYQLYTNAPTKRTMLLQYPNREAGQEYRAANGQKPLEVRIKPKCGLVEVDIPMNIHDNFDKVKGIEYGEAMRSSRVLQQGGSYGLAGGLGVGTKPTAKDTRRANSPEGPSHDRLLENYDDADNKGHVMNKITLGGLIVPFKDGDPIYVTATFKGDSCSFTKLDAMVQLRPKFDHLDALSDQGKSKSRNERADEEGLIERPEREARAVNMAVKSAETNDELDMYGGMSETRKLLIAMRDEPWQRLQWIDQDDDESFDVYDENLIYQDPQNAPQLVSEMTNDQYLDAISCPRTDPTKQGENVMIERKAPAIGSNANRKEDEDNSEDFDDDIAGEYSDGLDCPEGIVLPDLVTQIRVENAARKIGTFSLAKETAQESMLIQKVMTNPKLAKWSFMLPGDEFHAFYKWRLAEERAGRGIDPEEDMA